MYEDTILAGQAARLFRVFGFDHTEIIVAFVRGRKVYEISYTGSTPNDPDLAEHGAIYEHMKRSFQPVPSIDESRPALNLGQGDVRMRTAAIVMKPTASIAAAATAKIPTLGEVW